MQTLKIDSVYHSRRRSTGRTPVCQVCRTCMLCIKCFGACPWRWLSRRGHPTWEVSWSILRCFLTKDSARDNLVDSSHASIWLAKKGNMHVTDHLRSRRNDTIRYFKLYWIIWGLVKWNHNGLLKSSMIHKNSTYIPSYHLVLSHHQA